MTYQWPFIPTTPQGEYNRRKERELMTEDEVIADRRQEYEAQCREQAEDAQREGMAVEQ